MRNNIRYTCDYVMNPHKTAESQYISTFGCGNTTPHVDMNATKEKYGKQNMRNKGYHVIQSFAVGEVTPELAHKIGCELVMANIAQKYETVVTTHINKGHLHNHIVFNSVSCVDGSMYRNNLKDYFRDIREASDRLCKQYGLSVPEPKNKGKHYAEWKAEKSGQATWRDAVREYVDCAIKASYAMSDFLRNLKELGFEIKQGKHLAVRPPGKERFVRLRSLGENYTEETIKRRILAQNKTQPLHRHAQTVKKIRVYSNFFTLKRATWKGLRALYFYYICKLKQAKTEPSQKALFLLKEEMRYLDEISKQTQFLFEHKLDTAEQVLEYAKKTKVRGEAKLCGKILERSIILQEKQRILQQKLKTEVTHEHTGRSGRASRGDGNKHDR